MVLSLVSRLGKRIEMPFQNTGVLMIGLNGRIAFASTYFCDLVGLDHDKVPGMSCFDFVFPADMDEARKLFEANKLPHAAPFRFRLRRWDGTAVWTDIQGSALQTALGRVYGISATVTLAGESN
jgi:PAS domain S-box-containing protein